MRFFQIIATGAAFIASAIAQSSTVAINSYPSSVEAGKTYTITYSPNNNVPTTFLLRKGLSTDLKTISTLTASATGGSFSWTVDSTLVSGDDYALQIKQGDENNYSAQFSLSGSAAVSSAVSSAASSASSAASSVASSASSVASSVASSASSVASSVASSASSAASSAASSVASSLSSRVSSAASSMITSQSPMMMSSGVSGVISSSAFHNGTVSSATLSRSSGTFKPTHSGTTSAGIPENTSAASMLTSSPLSLIFGAFAAMLYLN